MEKRGRENKFYFCVSSRTILRKLFWKYFFKNDYNYRRRTELGRFTHLLVNIIEHNLRQFSALYLNAGLGWMYETNKFSDLELIFNGFISKLVLLP